MTMHSFYSDIKRGARSQAGRTRGDGADAAACGMTLDLSTDG